MNREEWLSKAVEALRPLFSELAGIELPDELAVSCGWPGGKSVNKVIGQCWPTATSDGVAQMFISPLLWEPVKVLATLVHELIHAYDDCQSGHKGPFARVARKMGLEGKLTATIAGEALAGRLADIAKDLGEYPHKAITPGERKPQSTRMRKVVCDADGYTLRTTAKWIEFGLPTCPCGNPMDVEEQ